MYVFYLSVQCSVRIRILLTVFHFFQGIIGGNGYKGPKGDAGPKGDSGGEGRPGEKGHRVRYPLEK